MHVRHRSMQQNATFCSPEQVDTKDIALYERLFSANNFFKILSGHIFIALLLAKQNRYY